MGPPWNRRFAVLASTQDAARDIAERGAPSLSVVVADFQTAGRGRHGRHWAAPEGTALTMSVVLRPRLPARLLPQVAMAVGLGALEALDDLQPATQSVFGLKWPNDLVVADGQAKVGGILIESWLRGNRIGETAPASVVVAGIGVNVSQTWAQLELGSTSLAEEGLTTVDRNELAPAVIAAIGRRLTAAESGFDLTPLWRSRLATLGREVRAAPARAGAASALSGRAVDVTAEGGLVLELADGSRHVVHAGDVTLAT